MWYLICTFIVPSTTTISTTTTTLNVTIPESTISASSWVNDSHSPVNATIDSDTAWIPDPNDEAPFIQVITFKTLMMPCYQPISMKQMKSMGHSSLTRGMHILRKYSMLFAR